jgi:hypothetical protein
MDQAWVVAVDMGLGHQRAAYPFRDIAYEGIITANTGPMVDPAERKRWMTMQTLYEGISRVNKVPVIGPWLWRTYDRLQAISPHYPFRDLSKPSLGSMRLDRLMFKGFGSSVVEHTRKREDLPLLTTFFAIALAADRLGRKDVFCVVTDTDVNRIWAAKVPVKGRIHYLAPTPLTRQRLMQYGVPPERIHFTGFPLPLENVATAAEDLRRRIPILDARGAFRHGYGRMIDAELGPAPAADGRPLSITFAVGGAGAQAELARDILRGLSGALCEGLMRLNLVAGVRAEVEQYFRRTIGELGLEAELGLIPKSGQAAVRLECFFLDGCVDSSSPSSSAFNSAKHSGGSQSQSVRRSFAIASRVRSSRSSHRPDNTAARSWSTASAFPSSQNRLVPFSRRR